jgi:MAC/Perforin domain
MVYVSTMGVCSVYSSSYNTYEVNSVEFQSNFINGVNSLTQTSDVNSFYGFLDAFGTHSISAMKMGSRYGEVSKFTEDNYMRL